MQGIPREKNDPLAQGRVLPEQAVGEGWPIQCGHQEVAQEHVIAPCLKLLPGELPIDRRFDRVPIPVEEADQPADKARRIVNHQNLQRRIWGHRLPLQAGCTPLHRARPFWHPRHASV
jgi:hypothetical protein